MHAQIEIRNDFLKSSGIEEDDLNNQCNIFILSQSYGQFSDENYKAIFFI